MANKLTFFSVPSYIKTLLLPGGTPASYPQAVVNPTPPPAPSTPTSVPEPKLVTSNVNSITPMDTTTLISPFNGGSKIIDVFSSPRVLGKFSIIHGGLDLSPVTGAPALYACCTGTVTFVVDYYGGDKINEPIGYAIDIKWAHSPPGHLYVFRYIHMAGPPTRDGVKLKANDTVTVGECVGTYDDTGYSFGNHLHLIVYDYALPESSYINFGAFKSPHVDPVPVFAAEGVTFS